MILNPEQTEQVTDVRDVVEVWLCTVPLPIHSGQTCHADAASSACCATTAFENTSGCF